MTVTVLAAFFSAVLLQAQTPPPQGRTVTARDGDTVIIANAEKVRVVRRREGNVRVVFNPEQRFLIMLIDQVGSGGAPPDGRVDVVFTLHDVEGEWPFDLRWDGSAIVDDYFGDSGPIAIGTTGYGITTPAGLVQMFNGRGVNSLYVNPAAVATLRFQGNGRSSGSGTFEQAEQQTVAQAMRTVQMRTNATGGQRFTATTSMTASGSSAGGMVVTPGSIDSQPIRVGGNIKTPARIHHVDGVLPETARQAGVSGMVILEAIIGPDGAVKDAKILRGIPLLDGAAIDAVRQWRYEPTLLNGAPVPVIMTVTVNFPK